MKLAYFVDIHDRIEAVARAMAQIGRVDLLIIGGDITTMGTPDDAAAAIGRWRPLAPTYSRSRGTWTRRRLMLA